MSNKTAADLPTRFGFLLVNDFTLISMSSAIEPLRMANTVSGKLLYRWRLCSDGLGQVKSSSGFTLSIDQDIGDVNEIDVLFVVASYDVVKLSSPQVLAFLRKTARGDTMIGGLDAAPYFMAAAGLLDGCRATTHWEDLEDFQNRYPRVDVVPERYVVDGNRATTSGSLPSFDFILDFIRRRNGLMVW